MLLGAWPIGGNKSSSLQHPNDKSGKCRFLILCSSYAMFLILGAAIFSVIEAPQVDRYQREFDETRKRFLEQNPCVKSKWLHVPLKINCLFAFVPTSCNFAIWKYKYAVHKRGSNQRDLRVVFLFFLLSFTWTIRGWWCAAKVKIQSTKDKQRTIYAITFLKYINRMGRKWNQGKWLWLWSSSSCAWQSRVPVSYNTVL